METAAGVRYYVTGTRAGKTRKDCPAVIHYADDLLALCHSRDQAEQVKAQLAGWLAPKPSKDALRRIRHRLSTEATALRGANADAVIAKLNPIITGWAAYYRIGVSMRACGGWLTSGPGSPTRTSRRAG